MKDQSDNVYPSDYAALIRDAILAELPELKEYVVEEPALGGKDSKLRIEMPSRNPEVSQSLQVFTYHGGDGSSAPCTEILWWEQWSADYLLTEEDPTHHIKKVVSGLRKLINEEMAPFNAWFKGRLTSGGAVCPADKDPFPVGRADAIKVRSWRGTFDRDLTGSWPGWPNDPDDPFYKYL